jgi:hypothetical protein
MLILGVCGESSTLVYGVSQNRARRLFEEKQLTDDTSVVEVSIKGRRVRVTG